MTSLSGLIDVLAFWRSHRRPVPFAVQFKKFRLILERNNRILELMADMGDKLGGEYVFDRQYIVSACETLTDLVFKLISDLSVLTQRRNVDLFLAFERIHHLIQEELAGRHSFPEGRLTISLDDLNREASEEAGNKLANLGDVRNVLGLPTPDGFVITTKAFFDFMAHNNLFSLVREGLARWDGKDEAGFKALSEDIRSRILHGELPRPLQARIEAALDVLGKRHNLRKALFAVRSSAWGEDGEKSFAGQYESVLAVPASGLADAYRRVLASAYSRVAWSYRRHMGFPEEDMTMAVGCQLMVDAAVSGCLYTYAPIPHAHEAIIINATWGLGASVADGSAEADTYVVERGHAHDLRSQTIAHKPHRLVAVGQGAGRDAADVVREDVEAPLRDIPCLTPEQRDRLTRVAMSIERFYKRPQDVEWSFNRQGELFILQARPLHIAARLVAQSPTVEDATRNAEVIFSGQGIVAQQGVAVGKVFVLRDDADLDRFPHGAILVSRFTSPRYSRIMRKAQGIITEVGSATGHMANLAREYRVPTVVNVGKAASGLVDGEEITLDATRNMVFRGAVLELRRFELTEEEVFEDSGEYRLLGRLLKRIAPLNLVDPNSDHFKPAACRTFHDITRWIHERAVEEIVRLSEAQWRFSDATPKRLRLDIPLGLMVVDLDGRGNGASGGQEIREVRPGELSSIPLVALLHGLTSSGMWSTEPVSVDLGSFMSSFTKTFSHIGAAPETLGRNLGVVSREYMNLHLRLGYHFTIVDAYMGEHINDNYIYFRFLGGVTDFVRRSRRARCISDILEKLDFRVEIHGDLVVGRIKKLSLDRMRDKMVVLGGLIGYTRQLDVKLHNDEDLVYHVEEFLKRIGPLLEV